MSHPLPALSRRSFAALSGATLGAAVAVAAPVGTLAAPAGPGDDPEDTLRLLRVPRGPATADGPVWSARATGFAGVPAPGLPDGAVGGLGGAVVTVRTATELGEQVSRAEPVTVLVEGSIELPLGTMLDVSSDTSVLGVGRGAEIVGGGLRLLEVRNVVIRNLTFRDSFVGGDWDGKLPDNDNDGIRIDTSDHVWIDHCEFLRLGDGQVDVRKDSTAVTLSWSILRDHNKTLGVGWTENLVTTLTLHHLWFSNVHQRNGSIDAVALCHAYNVWISGASSYGMTSRGGSQLLLENSVFEQARNPIGLSDPASRVEQRGNRREGTWGSWEDTGIDADPADHYSWTADPGEEVTELLTRHAGPHGRTERAPRRLHVAQDGSGDVKSVHAAVGVAVRSPHPVEILVHPGVYRETVSVWPGADGLVIRGLSGDPADVVLTYDKSAGDWATVTVLAPEVTLRSLTVENTYAGSGEAFAIRAADDSLALEDVVLRGGELVVCDPRD